MARPRSDIAPRIVAAARQRFLKQGVDGASLREIAREAGTNIGMVYYYFPTKDDLLLAVVEEIYGGMVSGIRAALSREAPLEERLALAPGNFDEAKRTDTRLESAPASPPVAANRPSAETSGDRAIG